MTDLLAPLDDPSYQPAHAPIDGQIPNVVSKWGPRTQLRWFHRFRAVLAPGGDWDRFYCASEHHRGSCWEEGNQGVQGWGVHCCCRDERIGR